MKKIIIGFLSLSLIGCAVHTPNGSVVVDPKGKHFHKHKKHKKHKHAYKHKHFYKHCPPGQAKKGRC